MERPSRHTGDTPTSLAAASFEPFFKENYAMVVRLANSVVGDMQQAQDVAQEVFLAAHRRLSSGPEVAAGWLRVATVHTALNTLRGDRRRERRHERLHLATTSPSAEEDAMERQLHSEVRVALRALPRRSAALLVMRHGGMSYGEIAAALGVNVGHVGTMLRRAESAFCKEMDRAARA